MAACNKQESDDKKDIALGRYIEEDIGFPCEGMRFLAQRQDGTVECYANRADKILFYTLSSEGKWIEGVAKFNEFPLDLKEILTMFYSQDDFYMFYQTVEDKAAVGKLGANGEFLTLKIEKKIESIENKYQVMRTEGGDYLIADGTSGVSYYDGKDGALKREYPQKVSSFQVMGDILYQLEFDNYSISSYSLKNGNLIDTLECDIKRGNIIRMGNQGDDIYLMNSTGILHRSKEGMLWERIVDAELTSFNLVEQVPDELFVRNEDFIVEYASSKGMSLKRYFYSESTPTRPAEQIEVYMLNDNNVIRQAIALYQLDHEEVLINVRIGRVSEGMTDEDAIKALNTELLTGKGPDLIVLDGLPIDTYIEKGVLFDLSEMIEESIKKENIFSNIAGAYYKDHKYYAIPMHFMIPMIWGDEEILKNINTLDELVQYKKAHSGEILLGKTTSELIYQFYLSCAPSWFDESGEINEQVLITFLEGINNLSEHTYDESEEGEYSYIPINEGKAIEKQMLDTAYNETSLFVLIPRSPYEVLLANSALVKRGEGTIKPLVGQVKGTFQVNNILGINANSTKKDVAKEIIQVALSEQVQDIQDVSGIPINKNSMKKLVSDIRGMVDYVSDGKGRRFDIDKKQVDVLKQFTNYCEEVSVLSEWNYEFAAILDEYAKEYFNGNKTVEEVVSDIKDVTKIRFNE